MNGTDSVLMAGGTVWALDRLHGRLLAIENGKVVGKVEHAAIWWHGASLAVSETGRLLGAVGREPRGAGATTVAVVGEPDRWEKRLEIKWGHWTLESENFELGDVGPRIALSDVGHRVILAGPAGLSVWDSDTGRMLAEVPRAKLEAKVRHVALAHGGAWAYALLSTNVCIRLKEPYAEPEVWRIPLPGRSDSFDVSPDGCLVAIESAGTAYVYEWGSEKERQHWVEERPVAWLKFLGENLVVGMTGGIRIERLAAPGDK